MNEIEKCSVSGFHNHPQNNEAYFEKASHVLYDFQTENNEPKIIDLRIKA